MWKAWAFIGYFSSHGKDLESGKCARGNVQEMSVILEKCNMH